MRNTIAASFHRWNHTKGLERVSIRQKFGNHTVAFLDYSIIKKNQYLLPPENTPVTARWGVGPTGVRTYYGYVNHYESLTDTKTGTVSTRLVSLGTSKVMNSTRPSSWLTTTRSAIAREIATRHKLRTVIHRHPYVMEQWASGTRTDFQVLQALAEEAGYRFWVDGSTLFFLDPVKLLRGASTLTTPVLREEDIKEINVMGGSNIPGAIDASKRQVQYGLDARSNEFFEVTAGDSTLPSSVSGSTVNTFSEAQAALDAVSRKQGDQFVLTVKIKGNSAIHPGALIRVNSGRVNNDQAGLWSVLEATHEITSLDFTTKIVATRGKDMKPLSRIPSEGRGATEFVPSVVRDGVSWEAALQEHLHV